MFEEKALENRAAIAPYPHAATAIYFFNLRVWHNGEHWFVYVKEMTKVIDKKKDGLWDAFTKSVRAKVKSDGVWTRKNEKEEKLTNGEINKRVQLIEKKNFENIWNIIIVDEWIKIRKEKYELAAWGMINKKLQRTAENFGGEYNKGKKTDTSKLIRALYIFYYRPLMVVDEHDEIATNFEIELSGLDGDASNEIIPWFVNHVATNVPKKHKTRKRKREPEEEKKEEQQGDDTEARVSSSQIEPDVDQTQEDSPSVLHTQPPTSSSLSSSSSSKRDQVQDTLSSSNIVDQEVKYSPVPAPAPAPAPTTQEDADTSSSPPSPLLLASSSLPVHQPPSKRLWPLSSVDEIDMMVIKIKMLGIEGVGYLEWICDTYKNYTTNNLKNTPLSSLIDSCWIHSTVVDSLVTFVLNTKRGNMIMWSAIGTAYAIGKEKNYKYLPPVDVIRSTDIIIIPVTVSNTHWYLLVVYVSKRTMRVYDSLGTSSSRHSETTSVGECIDIILNSSSQQRAIPWNIIIMKVTPQTDGSSCGVYMLSIALALMSGHDGIPAGQHRHPAGLIESITSSHCKYLRPYIADCIIKNQIVLPSTPYQQQKKDDKTERRYDKEDTSSPMPPYTSPSLSSISSPSPSQQQQDTSSLNETSPHTSLVISNTSQQSPATGRRLDFSTHSMSQQGLESPTVSHQSPPPAHVSISTPTTPSVLRPLLNVTGNISSSTISPPRLSKTSSYMCTPRAEEIPPAVFSALLRTHQQDTSSSQPLTSTESPRSPSPVRARKPSARDRARAAPMSSLTSLSSQQQQDTPTKDQESDPTTPPTRVTTTSSSRKRRRKRTSTELLVESTFNSYQINQYHKH